MTLDELEKIQKEEAKEAKTKMLLEQKLSIENAEEKIAHHLKLMQENLRAAQNIADEFGLMFEASLSLKDEDMNDNESGRQRSITGRYYGAGRDSYKDRNGEEIKSKPEWYWQNSSLNC